MPSAFAPQPCLATAAIICMRFLGGSGGAEPSSLAAPGDTANCRHGLFANPNPHSVILFIRTTEGKREDETKGSV